MRLDGNIQSTGLAAKTIRESLLCASIITQKALALKDMINMLNSQFDLLPPYPFKRLAALLNDPAPEGIEPLILSIGEPQNQPPAAVQNAIATHCHLWNKYPPNLGTQEFRKTITQWLIKRFHFPETLLDSERHVAPCPGTREALFLLGQICVPQQKNGQKPVVLLPDPFYHVYAASGIFAGAELVYLPATAETGYLPDLSSVSPEILARTALFFMCSPSNPQGAIASLETLTQGLALARHYDFTIAFDECYSEIYTSSPPPGGLQAALSLSVESPSAADPLSHMVVLQSLSKRSSAAGLRSGFMAGDPEIIALYGRLIGQGGTPTPLPILAAATALWKDEEHVEANRARYRYNFILAEERFGRLGFQRPGGGFFLWLNVGDGEAMAKTLWQRFAIRVMPGAYMCGGATLTGTENPGQAFIRVALVLEEDAMAQALDRLLEALQDVGLVGA